MARFFIDRPIFAWVLAIIVMLAGALSIFTLPIAQYPSIAPPAVAITANYPGASAKTLEDTVTQVIEQKMKGLDRLSYMASTSESSGSVTITLRAVFPNPNADLLPGMYVRAVLQEGVKEQALMVPQQAVSRDGSGKPMAYVVDAQHKLQRRVLETERAIGDQWLVRSGLQAGDKLVVDGQQRAAPGVEVKTVQWNPKSKPGTETTAKAALSSPGATAD